MTRAPTRSRAGWLAFVATACLVASPARATGLAADSPAATQQDTETGAATPSDLQAARALFQKNLDAIRRRDGEAYLACYLQSADLVRAAFTGPALGYDGLAAGIARDVWPEVFEGYDLRLVPVRPGVVYGSYRYRVRIGGEESSGISERLFVNTDDGWKIAVTSAFDAPEGTPPPPLALRGATLVDPARDAPIEDAVVLVRNGRIACAGAREECDIPAGTDVLDVTGLWITPGIIDAHVHFSQTGWVDGRPDALDVRETYPYAEVEAKLRDDPTPVFRSYLGSGVTAVFDAGGYPWTVAMAHATESQSAAPRVRAAGPLLSTVDFWLNLPGEKQFLYLPDEDAAVTGVEYLASLGVDAVKVWLIPDTRTFDERKALLRRAAAEAQARDLPLIVHATDLEGAKAAIAARAHLLVHSVDSREVDGEFLAQAERRETIYCPTLTVLDGYAALLRSLASGESPPVDDPHGCVDPDLLTRIQSTPSFAAAAPDSAAIEERLAVWRTRRETARKNLRRVYEYGIPIAMGTDAGNPLTLPGVSVFAEMEAMQEAGMPPSAVLMAATMGGAAAMGREADLGSVTPGKLADLLVLAEDPTADIRAMRALRYVVRGGVVREVEEFQARTSEP
jgi:imidazolonepropionase-like amidohydrolase